MLKNKKLVIFDLDGTLIDSMELWNEIDRKLIEAIGGKVDDINIAEQRDRKLKEYSKYEDIYLEYYGFLKNKYNPSISMNKEEIKELRYQIADYYLEEKVEYKPEAEQVLKYLKQKGFLLAIASTTGNHAIEMYKNKNKNIRNKANLEETFSTIYAREDVKEKKPNPEVHYKILEELKVEPEECLIVEDSLIGIEAANNAGIEVAVMYDKSADANRRKINRLSQYQFENFKQMLSYIEKEMK